MVSSDVRLKTLNVALENGRNETGWSGRGGRALSRDDDRHYERMRDNWRMDQRLHDQHLQNRQYEQRLWDRRIEDRRQERLGDKQQAASKQQASWSIFGSSTPPIAGVSSPGAASSLKNAVIKTGLLLAGVVLLATLGKDEEPE